MLKQNLSMFKMCCRIAMLALLFCGFGCFGPPMVRYHAEKRLHEEDVNEELIRKISRCEDIGRENFLIYSQHKDENVRSMIAFNRYIPSDILLSLAGDHSDLVIQCVIQNPTLSEEILAELLNNPAALKRLASSPQVPQEIIMKVYKQHKEVPLYEFAMNPRCPDVIKADIRKSDDFEAKRVLELHERNDKKQSGRN